MTNHTTTFEFYRASHDEFEQRRIESGFMLPSATRLPAAYKARPFAPVWVSEDQMSLAFYAGHDAIRDGDMFPGWWGFRHFGIAPCPLPVLVQWMHEHLTPKIGVSGGPAEFPGARVWSGNFVEFSFAHHLVLADEVPDGR
jgi:hypothetical protein